MSFSKTMARYEKWPLKKLVEAERAGWEQLKAQVFDSKTPDPKLRRRLELLRWAIRNRPAGDAKSSP